MKFKSFALILLVFHKAVRSFKDLPEQFLANENVKLLLFREERRYFDAKIFCQEKDAELIYINTTEKFNLLKTFYKLQYSVKPDKNQLIWFNNEEEFGDASASCTAFSIIESVSDNRFQKNCKDNLPFVCEVPRK